MRGNEEKRLQRVVTPLCATLFALFAFFFVAKYQSPLIEALYNQVATGKLAYNGYFVGVVVSVALTVLALWLNRYARFQREWTALAYLPSTLILAFITDIDRTIYVGGHSYMGWVVVFAVGILVYALLSFVLQRILFEKIKNIAMGGGRMAWRNLIIFLLLFCLAGTLSNGEENFKREALAASRYADGDVEGALEVGYLSLDASRQLTAMRSYILGANNLVGERLFEYPQYYGANGLLPSVAMDSPLVPDSVYSLLGTRPAEGEGALAFLKRAASVDSASTAATDYYLSALLLERNLLEFKDELSRLYGNYSPDSLPKHYREALLLCSEFADDFEFESNDTLLRKQFAEMRELEQRYSDALVRNNYVRRSFGRTYWWYYLYGM